MLHRGSLFLIASTSLLVSCSRSTPVADGGRDSSPEVDGDQDESAPRPQVDVLGVLDSDRYGSPSYGRDVASVYLGPFLVQVADAAGLSGDDMRVSGITANLGDPGLDLCQRADGTSWSDEAVLIPLLTDEEFWPYYYCDELQTYMTIDNLEEYGSCVFEIDSYPESCPYLMPLRALAMAFERPENSAFFRPEAHLLVIIFVNRDDCSFTDGSFLIPDLRVASPEICSALHQHDLLDTAELARTVSEEVGHRGLTVLFFGGEDHPVSVTEDEHGILMPVYEPCSGGGSYDHVTPTPRIHDFLDELIRLRDDPEMALRFDTCAVARWNRGEDISEIIEYLRERITS